jgi:alanyl-tRNA synthetase
VDLPSADAVKNLAFGLEKEVENLFMVLGTLIDAKPGITVAISEKLVAEKGLNAGQIVRELGKEIQGGGGGQAHFATAGGKYPEGLDKAIHRAKEFIE